MSDSHAAGEPCCGACASGLAAGERVERGAPFHLDGRTLVVAWADQSGSHEAQFDPPGPITIGRGRDCGVVIASGKVSRLQCTIDVFDAGLALVDAGSGCGTFVNGERIKRMPLHQNDKVFIGDSVLTFRLR